MLHNNARLIFMTFAMAFCLSSIPLASAVETQTVTYNNGEQDISAYLVLPDGEGPHPAIVVIHEWWGLTDWVKDNAKRFAEQGYAALCVDLYRGKSTSDAQEAHELMRLPDDQAVRDMKAGFAYLQEREDVQDNNIGCIGWCMGGGYALKAALNISDLDACVICYGRLVTDKNELAPIQCPILGLFGAEDRGIPGETVRKFESQAKDAGKDVEIHIYEGVGHAFMRGDADSTATKKAWREIDEFFKSELMQ